MAGRFQGHERHLILTAALIVFSRVFAFSLTTLGFTEYARGLVPSGTSPAAADLWAGLALGAYGITMALAQLGTGILSDRVGRRRVLVVGSLVFVAGSLLCVLATDVRLLVAGRLMAGLGGVSSAAMAAVGETVAEERRTTAMALIGIPAGIGVFLGFAVGPLVASAWGFVSLFWLTAIMGLVPLFGLRRPLPATQPTQAQPRRSLSAPVMALALAGFSMNFAMSAVMFDFKTGVLDDLGSALLGLLLLVAFIVMGVASRAIDRMSRRGTHAARFAIALCLALLTMAAPTFRLADAQVWVLVAGAGFFAVHATLSAVLPSQVSRLAGRSGGTGHGIQLVVAYLGSAAGALAAGASAPHLVAAFEVLALVAAAACGFVWLALRVPAGNREGAPETLDPAA